MAAGALWEEPKDVDEERLGISSLKEADAAFFCWTRVSRLKRPSWLGNGLFLYMMNHSDDILQTVDQRVHRIVEDVLVGTPLYVVEIVVRGVKGSRVVEVYVDSDEALSVDTLAKVNREVGFLLETEEVIEGRYTLNVSSPGVDRPLRLPRQYKKNIGRTLKVKYMNEEKRLNVQGELINTAEEFIELNVKGGTLHRISMEDIVESKIVLPW